MKAPVARKEIRIKVICYVEKRWEKYTGKKWKSFVNNILGSVSKLLSTLLDVDIQLELICVVHFKDIDTRALNSMWRKENIRTEYKRAYPWKGRVKELFILDTVLNIFRSWIENADFSELGNPDYTSYLHIGFFDLYRVNGGGMAARITEKIKLPIIILHRSGSLKVYMETLAHELLHVMGASHSRAGIMAPSYPINTSFLDRKNRVLVRNRLMRRIRQLSRQ